MRMLQAQEEEEENVTTRLQVPIDTFAGFSDARITELTAQIPSRRFGKPSEVADAIMFLLHNEYANNCILNLDGGLSAV